MLERLSTLAESFLSPTYHQNRVHALHLRQLRIGRQITAIPQNALEALQRQWREFAGQSQKGRSNRHALPLDQIGMRSHCRCGRVALLLLLVLAAVLGRR